MHSLALPLRRLPWELHHLINLSSITIPTSYTPYSYPHPRPLSLPSSPPTFTPSELFESTSSSSLYSNVPPSSLDVRIAGLRKKRKKIVQVPKSNEQALIGLIEKGDWEGAELLRGEFISGGGGGVELKEVWGKHARDLLLGELGMDGDTPSTLKMGEWIEWFDLFPLFPPQWAPYPPINRHRNLVNRISDLLAASLSSSSPSPATSDTILKFISISCSKGYFESIANHLLLPLARYYPEVAEKGWEEVEKGFSSNLPIGWEGRRGREGKLIKATEDRLSKIRSEMLREYLRDTRNFSIVVDILSPSSANTNRILPFLPTYNLALLHLARFSQYALFEKLWAGIREDGSISFAWSKRKGREGVRRRGPTSAGGMDRDEAVGEKRKLIVILTHRLGSSSHDEEVLERIEGVEEAYSAYQSTLIHSRPLSTSSEPLTLEFLSSLFSNLHRLSHQNLPSPSSVLQLLSDENRLDLLADPDPDHEPGTDSEDNAPTLTQNIRRLKPGPGTNGIKSYWANVLLLHQSNLNSDASGGGPGSHGIKKMRKVFERWFDVGVFGRDVRDVLGLDLGGSGGGGVGRNGMKLIPTGRALYLLLKSHFQFLIHIPEDDYRRFFNSLLSTTQLISSFSHRHLPSPPLASFITTPTPSPPSPVPPPIFSLLLLLSINRNEPLSTTIGILEDMRSKRVKIGREQIGIVVGHWGTRGSLEEEEWGRVFDRVTSPSVYVPMGQGKGKGGSEELKRFMAILNDEGMKEGEYQLDLKGYTNVLKRLRKRGERDVARGVLRRLTEVKSRRRGGSGGEEGEMEEEGDGEKDEREGEWEWDEKFVEELREVGKGEQGST